MRKRSLLPSLAALLTVPLGALHAQAPGMQASRLQAVSVARVVVAGTILPRARHSVDLGAAPANQALTSVTLRFNMTAVQSAALDQLLLDQQNPASPRYHQWLTPEQYAAQFGLNSADLATVSAWLTGQGLTVTGTARSHSFITVSGTVGQVQSALGTSIHAVLYNGEKHFANLSDPLLPASIAGVVSGITGLNDFHLKPHARVHKELAPDPRFTSSLSGNHYIAPGDYYTIYDVNPLLTSSINGTGITIAVMGQTNISTSDVSAFRAASGLSTTNLPTTRLYGSNPGTSADDIDEAQLDVEWSGAIAPSASILYVNSTDVIAGSLTQAIDNNLAPIITISYGDCENDFGSSNIATYNQLFRQANVQGQTIVGPSGDSGATDCDYQDYPATAGLAVDFPASSPYVTALGGTMFNEGSGTYFGTTNNANGGSALSYIPEAVWNETSSTEGLAAGGGGFSSYFTKPSYQVGNGVPADASRDVPDLAFNAAAVHDGYLFCSQGWCTNGFRDSGSYLDVVGGTSVSTPSFAGILALLEQKIGTRIGNANPTIYGLANSTYASAVFHDVTAGNNKSPCTAGSANCATGGSLGYNASTGYDLATGWGSVDAFNMVNDWLLATPTGVSGSTGVNVSATNVVPGNTQVTAGTAISVVVSVVSATSGLTTTPTGTVQLVVDNAPVGSPVALTAGSANLTVATIGLASGGHTVTVAYSGDSTYVGSKGSFAIDILAAATADFKLSPVTATASASSGSAAAGLTFTVSSLNGFTGAVTFSAGVGSQTLSAQYTFAPTTVTLSSGGSGSTVLTLDAYQTSGATSTPLRKPGSINAAENEPAHRLPWKVAGSGAALAGLLFLALPRRRRRLAGLLVAVLSVTLLGVSGCSESGSAPGTGTTPITTPVSTTTPAAPGTYIITVSATNGTITHNSTVTFTVH